MKEHVKKLGSLILATTIVLFLFYAASGNSLYYSEESTGRLNVVNATPVILRDQFVEQKIVGVFDTITSIEILPVTYDRLNTDIMLYEVYDQNRNTVATGVIETSVLTNTLPYEIVFDEPITDARNTLFTLRITSTKGSIDNGVGLCFGSAYKTIRGEVPLHLTDDNRMFFNNDAWEASLYYVIRGRHIFKLGDNYIAFSAMLLCFVSIVYLKLSRDVHRGKKNQILNIFFNLKRYRFLIKQMVKRDFKTKYKRSILGAVWSILNPLFMMLVQYMVFSTLFKSDIENFALYLLMGIVSFNYFSEVVSMCLVSIVSNTNLITKVYVPKYIFPFSRALSSTINLLLAFIPLTFFVIITKSPISKALFLMPIGVVYLFLCSFGFGLIFCTLMVFFRDTQFLWGVISMVWLYLTPIFYPVSIIPENLLKYYNLNPIYQIISYFRVIILDGVAPTPSMHISCILSALLPLVVGAVLFKRYQDKFILNI